MDICLLQFNESLSQELGHLFHLSAMKKKVNNNNSNEDKAGEQISWEQTKAYTMGLKVNEENQQLINERKAKDNKYTYIDQHVYRHHHH